MRRAVALAIVTLTFLTAATAAPSHGQGPFASGIDFTPGPLDVLAVAAAHHPDERPTMLVTRGWLQTPHGLVTIVRPDWGTGCTLVHVEPTTLEARRRPLADCERGVMVTYDPASDLLVTCNTSQDTLVAGIQGRDAADGTTVWSVSLEQLGAAPSREGGEGAVWLCGGGDSDPERAVAVVPILSSRSAADLLRHRIVEIDVTTGTVRWIGQVPAWSPVARPPVGWPPDPLSGFTIDGAGGNYAPLTAIYTEAGVVVAGARACVDLSRCSMGDTSRQEPPNLFLISYAWFNLEGTFHGEITDVLPQAQQVASPLSLRGSTWALPVGALGHAALDDRLIIIDPAANEAATAPLLTGEGAIRGLNAAFPPVTDGQRLFVPLQREIHAFSLGQFDESLWVRPPEVGGLWFYPTASTTDSGELLVVYMHAVQSDLYSLDPGDVAIDRSRLLRLDARSGDLLQRIPLEISDVMRTEPEAVFAGIDTISWFSGVLPYPVGGDRLVVISSGTGEAALIGPADPSRAPAVRLAQRHPASGEAAVLHIEAHPQVIGTFVTWGDNEGDIHGNVERLEHVYAEAGRHEILVTFQFDDHTTATRQLVVHVDGEPPSFLELAFARDNQDVTFFLLGLLLTAYAAALGLLARRRGRGRITHGLAELRSISRQAEQDASGALAALAAWHARQDEALVRGRLTEDQFTVLEERGTRLLRKVTRRALEPLARKWARPLRTRLEVVLADGFVSIGEAEALRRHPSWARLDEATRTGLEAILGAWSREA